MKKTLALLAITILFGGCELIVLGTAKKQKQTVEINQKTPLGTVYLFKSELDSNDIPSATRLLAHPEGKPYLAIEKYDIYDDIARLRRVMGTKPITDVKSDSLTDKTFKISLELNYIKTISFMTERIKDNWYIVSYGE